MLRKSYTIGPIEINRDWVPFIVTFDHNQIEFICDNLGKQINAAYNYNSIYKEDHDS